MKTEIAFSNSASSPMLLELMRKCGVETPPSEFITEVSNIYHEIEAPLYDSGAGHREMATRVTPIIHQFGNLIHPAEICVLDVGCGTGFASSTLLENHSLNIRRLVCGDISPHMLQICRAKLGPRPNVECVQGDIESLSRKFSSFDVVMSCSVVHHVPDLPSFYKHVKKLVSPGGFYMMLHEPSRRFYRNPECSRLFEEYKAYKRMRMKLRYLNPLRYVRKAIHLVAGAKTASLELRTSELLLKRKVIKRALTAGQVRQLVDIHVPPIHSDTFDIGSHGFDIRSIQQEHLAGFSPLCFRSYGFLGTEFEEVAGRWWRGRATQLSRLYPDDGAQFCALWQQADLRGAASGV